MTKPTRDEAARYIAWIVDTSGNAYSPDDASLSFHLREVRATDTLVGFQVGFEPLFVAVRDTYSSEDGQPIIDADEAQDLAIDYLTTETDWFADGVPEAADYVFEGVQPPSDLPKQTSAHQGRSPTLC